MRFSSISAPVAALALCATAFVVAADPVKPAAKSSAHVVHRTSQVVGMAVQNPGGKEIGTINDIVVDLTDGRIRYLAVSYGGWAGLGDKLFAVPLKAFQFKYDAENKKYEMVLNVPEDRLKAAPGFDQDHWPNFAGDEQWQREIDTYYNLGEKVSRK